MISKGSKPLGQYATVNAYGASESSDGPQLILTMMRTAQDRIASARGHMERHEAQAKGEQIGKAIALVDALRASLDYSQGGEIAGNLEALYDYMSRRLVEANVRNDNSALTEVSGLLGEIRDAWEQVVRQQQPATVVAG